MSIKRLCCAPGCSRFRDGESRWCAVHRPKYEADEEQRKQEYLSMRYQHRDSKYKELYSSSEWRRLRAEYLKSHPYCECCGATVDLQVHHRYPKGVDYSSPEMFFNEDSLETLCRSCHAKETDKLMG